MVCFAANTTDVITVAVAFAAFLVSAVMGGFRYWELRLRKAEWDLWSDWRYPEGKPMTLVFTVANVGHRKFGIREISFGTTETSAEDGWVRDDVMEDLPLLLDEGEVSKIFYVEVPEDSDKELDRHFAEGRITKCFVIDAKNHPSEYQVKLPEVTRGKEVAR